MVHMCCAYDAYHALVKFVKSKHDILLNIVNNFYLSLISRLGVFLQRPIRLMQGILGFLFPIIHFMHGYIGDSTLRTLQL